MSDHDGGAVQHWRGPMMAEYTNDDVARLAEMIDLIRRRPDAARTRPPHSFTARTGRDAVQEADRGLNHVCHVAHPDDPAWCAWKLGVLS